MSALTELTQLFSDEKFVLSVFTAAFTVVYAVTAQRILFRSRERRKDRKSRLWETLSAGFSNGTLNTVDDVVNIYKGIHELGGEDVSYRAGLAKYLREYLVNVISSKDREADEISAIKDKVTGIIDAIETESPYSDVPAAERNLIVDVQKFIAHNDQESAREKLSDLAGLIEVRQDSLDRVQASNKWSVPLAVIGLVLTVVFGVISLIK
ncbi:MULTISPECIES: hypothetical protein [unclassified Pseudoalteromonas]|uniref:hypothetical protein n=1 Tax=unclassified Pseudoalteromonas TaxID=194690 RepID=UPI0015FFDAB1|nr:MULTISPECIES: hypothetical protein [unclassified Pseudoalteromonas]MBB1410207.1 hypothetical protein [Pseudoalteromonas sp. SG44-17]MBB1469318.1 hypothetical protein [Pseudoalteromonas sp. SG41-5]